MIEVAKGTGSGNGRDGRSLEDVLDDAVTQSLQHHNRASLMLNLVEPEPPAADRVARRALVFSAVVCRSGIEQDLGNRYADSFRVDDLKWLVDAGATGEAQPGELRLPNAPLGTLTERDVVDASWRGEGLGVLAWALGKYRLPSYELTTSPPDVAYLLGFMEPAGLQLANRATLPDSEDLIVLADRLFALHWRLRQFSITPEHMDFRTFAAAAQFGPLDVAGLHFVNGDLAIDGRALFHVPEERCRECMSIARERQQAANWLCGQDALYSKVTCDT